MQSLRTFEHSHTGAQVKMTKIVKTILSHIPKRTPKSNVQPVAARRLGQSAEQTARNDVQPQVSGDLLSPPHGENRWHVPVFGTLTVTQLLQNVVTTGTLLLSYITFRENSRPDNEKIEMKQKIVKLEQTISDLQQGEKEMEQRISEIKQNGLPGKIAIACENNTNQMSVAWSEMALSRKAVLNKTYKSNLFSDLRELLGMANNSKADETTPAPDSVDDVMQFFLWWKFYQDNKTIDSTHLMKRLGSEFDAFHDILTEIRDDEASDWDEADSDNLSEVVDFLDELSK